ncbi:hypothetical protein BTO30_15175 [Domibacillus antri]|uniref:Helix-turn-helix domain-containing protein n=1 Tax=Domibacillus antri TaxID=1714264 RepID=A0A1Q8Q245_9BACI|nr:helix-turn-helix domain-containing protein [Domibacillus antri]OLN21387.1 hypothetical protein BTO30_15175 [Domibacillus antri]
MIDISNCYTTKEAAEVLGKSAVTIGHYIRIGKLKPVEDIWGGHRGYLFEKAKVEQLKEEQEKMKPLGMMTGEASDYLKVSRAVILSYLQEGLIPYQKELWRNREVTIIEKNDLDLFQEQHKERLIEDRLKQRTFYDRKNNYAFYQRFSSSTINEARLICKSNGIWGFLLMDSGNEVSYEEGIYKYELSPDYSLSFGKRTGTPGYAKLSLPLNLSLSRQFFDLLYQQFDLSNVYMEFSYEENNVTIYLKDALFNMVENAEGITHFLESKMIEGEVAGNAAQIRIESSEKSLSIHLPTNIKKKIKQLAEERGTTMQEISKKIILDYFK